MTTDPAMDRVFAWVEATLDGRIVARERHGRWRPQWFLTVQDRNGTRAEVMLRGRSVPGLRGTVTDEDTRRLLAYEAAIIRAVQGTGVAAPAYHGYDEQDAWILMERLPGTSAIGDDVGPDTRFAIARDYVANLARLHALDPATLDLPPMDVPRGAEITLGTQRYRRARYESYNLIEPEPLLDFASWWIDTHAPAGRTEVRLLQGDCGPGQFMVDGDRVAGLIDWELAKLGDPLEDLGGLRSRSTIYPMARVPELLDHYASILGRPVDREAVHFYTVVWMLLTPLSVAQLVQRPRPEVAEQLAILGWDAVGRRAVCEALLESYGVPFEREPPLEELPSSRAKLHRLLAGRLQTLHAPADGDAFATFQHTATVHLAEVAVRADAVGALHDELDLADMTAVLGRRPADRREGMAALSRLVAEDPEGHAVPFLQAFYRMQVRHEDLLEPIITGAGTGYALGLEPLPGGPRPAAAAAAP